MGIRFKCHLCESPLHVKSDLASKRGVCPKCQGKFRIPASSQAYSIDLSDSIGSASSNRLPDSISSATTFDHQPVANTVNKRDKGIDPISKVASSAKKDRSHGVSINGTHEHLSNRETERVKGESSSRVEGSSTTTSAKRKQVDEQSRKQRTGGSQGESSAIIEADIAPLLEKSKSRVSKSHSILYARQVEASMVPHRSRFSKNGLLNDGLPPIRSFAGLVNRIGSKPRMFLL